MQTYIDLYNEYCVKTVQIILLRKNSNPEIEEAVLISY